MTRHARTSRLVRTIDTEAALPLVAAVYEAIYGEPLPSGAHVIPQVLAPAMHREKDGFEFVDLVTIHTEGVGYYLTDHNTIEVICESRGRDFFIPLHPARIPLLPEPVDFAKHVRTFGDRLESNWSLWDRRMEAAKKALAKGAGAQIVPDGWLVPQTVAAEV